MQIDNIKYAPEIDHLISQIERRGGLAAAKFASARKDG